MRQSHVSRSSNSAMLPLQPFDVLQGRYQPLALQERAEAMLSDATPALMAAAEVLRSLSQSPKIRTIITKFRKNSPLIEKMRPSEARNMLMDPHMDFLDVAQRKLEAWRKTMMRLANGEGIIKANQMEYIPQQLPIALAYGCICNTTHYLSIIQLLLQELEKRDPKHAESYQFSIARIRRCSTVLSDCHSASEITKHIH